jgi:hypothetical protein
MDFDALRRALVDLHPGRLPRRAVAGGLVGAGLIRVGAAPAAAACKSVGRKCGKPKECCAKLCKGGTCKCRALGQTCRQGANCCGSPTVACNHNEKPECGQDGFRCLRLLYATCTDDCECAVGMVCAGFPVDQWLLPGRFTVRFRRQRVLLAGLRRGHLSMRRPWRTAVMAR